MFGLAIRIGQRMKIHSESANKKCTILEAEMRRRLWWAMVIFDARISEKSDHKELSLAPTWNCKPPMNVNDFDLQAEMKIAPTASREPTELVFTVVRSELHDFIRYSTSFLDFSNPVLDCVAGTICSSSERGDFTVLGKELNDKYLKFLNLENPLHFVTLWTARGILARSSLLQYLAKFSKATMPQTDAQRNDAISHAVKILECDTQILASPTTKRFQWWFLHLQFPLPAYLYIAQDLKKRPFQSDAESNWKVLSDNYEARYMNMAEMKTKANEFFKMFCRVLLQAWRAREAAPGTAQQSAKLPAIIINIKQALSMLDTQKENPGEAGLPMDVVHDNFSTNFEMESINDGYWLGENAPVWSDMGTSHILFDPMLQEDFWIAPLDEGMFFG